MMHPFPFSSGGIDRFEIAAWKKSSQNKRDGNETNSTSRGVYIKEWPHERTRAREARVPFLYGSPRQIGCRIKLSDYLQRFIMFRSVARHNRCSRRHTKFGFRVIGLFFNRRVRFNFRFIERCSILISMLYLDFFF